MKHFLPAVVFALLAVGLSSPLQAYDHVRYRFDSDRLAVREGGPDKAERRERMRTLREEMQRTQPTEPRHISPDRRDFMPLRSRDPEVIRRLSPEERREFRRQLHDAGRNVYQSQ